MFNYNAHKSPENEQTHSDYFLMLAALQVCSFFSTITHTWHVYNSRTHFLPLETVFKTHHLDLRKEPVPDSLRELREHQPLPKKAI